MSLIVKTIFSLTIATSLLTTNPVIAQVERLEEDALCGFIGKDSEQRFWDTMPSRYPIREEKNLHKLIKLLNAYKNSAETNPFLTFTSVNIVELSDSVYIYYGENWYLVQNNGNLNLSKIDFNLLYRNFKIYKITKESKTEVTDRYLLIPYFKDIYQKYNKEKEEIVARFLPSC